MSVPLYLRLNVGCAPTCHLQDVSLSSLWPSSSQTTLRRGYKVQSIRVSCRARSPYCWECCFTACSVHGTCVVQCWKKGAALHVALHVRCVPPVLCHMRCIVAYVDLLHCLRCCLFHKIEHRPGIARPPAGRPAKAARLRRLAGLTLARGDRHPGRGPRLPRPRQPAAGPAALDGAHADAEAAPETARLRCPGIYRAPEAPVRAPARVPRPRRASGPRSETRAPFRSAGIGPQPEEHASDWGFGGRAAASGSPRAHRTRWCGEGKITKHTPIINIEYARVDGAEQTTNKRKHAVEQ